MKIQRGIFIDFENFQETNNDQKVIKELISQLKTDFKLIKFNDCPKEKVSEMKNMEKQSKKMFYRASFMLTARERELRRKEMLQELGNGTNIITINYCFSKFSKFLQVESDINFAKQLFRGLIRPDIVIFQKSEDEWKELFTEYNIFHKVNDEKENLISNYKDEMIQLYQSTKQSYQTMRNNFKKNFYPYSIGEDLFIDWPS